MLPIIKPMEPKATDQLITERNWLYQVKFDGVRILANVHNETIQLYTRNGKSRTQTYPEVVKELEQSFIENSVILDGEMVAFKQGRPDFSEVMKRDRLQNIARIRNLMSGLPVYYMVFDILFLNNEWLLDKPLLDRINLLEELNLTTAHVQMCPTSEDGEVLLSYTKENAWEGIVMKEKNGSYYLGQKHPTWRKIKHYKITQAIVVGVERKNRKLCSLLLAQERDHELCYIGKASTGLSQKDWSALNQYLEYFSSDTPVIQLPTYEKKDVVWMKPKLKIQVKFLEFTSNGQLRSPIILGFMY